MKCLFQNFHNHVQKVGQKVIIKLLLIWVEFLLQHYPLYFDFFIDIIRLVFSFRFCIINDGQFNTFMITDFQIIYHTVNTMILSIYTWRYIHILDDILSIDSFSINNVSFKCWINFHSDCLLLFSKFIYVWSCSGNNIIEFLFIILFVIFNYKIKVSFFGSIFICDFHYQWFIFPVCKIRISFKV